MRGVCVHTVVHELETEQTCVSVCDISRNCDTEESRAHESLSVSLFQRFYPSVLSVLQDEDNEARRATGTVRNGAKWCETEADTTLGGTQCVYSVISRECEDDDIDGDYYRISSPERIGAFVTTTLVDVSSRIMVCVRVGEILTERFIYDDARLDILYVQLHYPPQEMS